MCTSVADLHKKDGYFEVVQAFSLASETAASESVKLEQRKASYVTQAVRYARRSSCQVRPRERQGGRREGGARLRRYRVYREPGRRALTSLYCAVYPRQLRCRALNDREFGVRDSFATWQVQAEEGIASRISTSEVSAQRGSRVFIFETGRKRGLSRTCDVF